MTSPAAMPGSAHLFHNHGALVSVQEDCQHRGNEEEDCVHNPEHPRCFQHVAGLVNMDRQVYAESDSCRIEIVAVDVSNSQVVVGRNECSDETEIDKGHEQCRAPSRAESDHCRKSPGAGEH